MPINNVLFANSTAKSLENKCLNAERLNRLIDSASLVEAKKILFEIGYDGIDTDTMIANEITKTYEILQNISPDNAVTSAFMKKNDYHNAKVLIKAKYIKSNNYESFLYKSGNLDVIDLKDKIFTDNYVFLPSFMASALNKIDLYFATQDKNPIIIDSYLNQAMYEDIISVLNSNSAKEIKKYFESEIDILNISTAIRMRVYSISAKNYKIQFINGGLLTENMLLTFIEGSMDGIVEGLKYTPYTDLGKKIVEDLMQGNGLVNFETESDKFLIEIFLKHKFTSDSFMPFYGYIIGKLLEIKNVRIVLSCISNNLDKSQIRMRLRKLYV